MIYLDTSVLGAIYFREPGAARLVGRLERQRTGRLMISAWTLTEMASGEALHLAVARRLGARLASLDRRLCSATKALGLALFELA